MTSARAEVATLNSPAGVVEDCDFCGLAENPMFPYDVSEPIDPNGDVLLKPTLGMQVPGYFLAITAQHLTSFARLSEEQLGATDEALDRYEEFLPGNYFRVEHGSDNITACGSGGCIDHAHIHLIPADNEAGDLIQAELPWQQLPRYEDIKEFAGQPYIYLQRKLGGVATHFVVPNPKLPGQWVRRKVAEAFGYEDWDWGTLNDDWQVSQHLSQLGWGPGWKEWPHGRWHYDPGTGEWVVRTPSNQQNLDVREVLRTWSIGVPGSPGSHADLERRKTTNHTL